MPLALPAYQVELDPDNPINTLLIYAQLYGLRTPLGTGLTGSPYPFVTASNATFSNGALGPALTVASGEARQSSEIPAKYAPSDDCDWSMRWLFEPTSVSNYNCLLRSLVGSPAFGIYVKAGQIDMYYNGDNLVSGATVTVNTVTDVLITKKAGSTTVSVYVNGVPYSVTVPSSNLPVASAGNYIWGDQFSQPLLGRRYQYLAWNRTLSASEVQRLYQEPFSILRSPRQRAYQMISTAFRRRPLITVNA